MSAEGYSAASASTGPKEGSKGKGKGRRRGKGKGKGKGGKGNNKSEPKEVSKLPGDGSQGNVPNENESPNPKTDSSKKSRPKPAPKQKEKPAAKSSSQGIPAPKKQPATSSNQGTHASKKQQQKQQERRKSPPRPKSLSCSPTRVSPRKEIKPFGDEEIELLESMYTEEEFRRNGDDFSITIRPQVGGLESSEKMFVEAVLKGVISTGVIYIGKVAGLSAEQNAELAKLLATTTDSETLEELELFERIQKLVDRISEMNKELDQECPICLMDFEEGEQENIVRLAGCFHAHHKTCLSKWWFGTKNKPAWRPEAEDMAKTVFKKKQNNMLCAVCRAQSTIADRLAVMPDWADPFKDEFLPDNWEAEILKNDSKSTDLNDEGKTIMIRTESGAEFNQFFENVENEFDGVVSKYSFKATKKRDFYFILLTFGSSKQALDVLLELNNMKFGTDGDFFHVSFHARRRSSARRKSSLHPATNTFVVLENEEDEIQEQEKLEAIPLIEKCWLLCHLDKFDVDELLDYGVRWEVDEGENITDDGDDPDSLFLVLEGELRSDTNASYKPEMMIGEESLLYSEAECDTVTAVTDSIVWQFPIEIVKEKLGDFMDLKIDQGRSFLSTVPLVQRLPEEFHEIVISMFVPEHYFEGDVIMVEGDLGDRFYIFEWGEIVATKFSEELFRYTKPGDHFGELSLLNNTPRACTLTVTSKEARLWSIRWKVVEIIPNLVKVLDDLTKNKYMGVKAKPKKKPDKKKLLVKRPSGIPNIRFLDDGDFNDVDDGGLGSGVSFMVGATAKSDD
eukprot:gene132-309_t